MEDRFDEEDRDALAAVANGPPNRKAHSLSTNIRHGGAIPTATGPAAGGGSKRGGHHHNHPHHHHRSNHSFDNDRLPLHMHSNQPTFDSSDDEGFYPYSAAAGGGAAAGASARYDHSISLPTSGSSSSIAEEDQQQGALPEFTASGGVGIFKAPTRAAVHPSRPPALELRPHPLRETQVGKFLRTIGCTDTQLWAGQESGVRFWKFSDVYDSGSGFGGRVRRGDEDAAPFYESGNTSPTMCIVVDHGNRLVWTGHKDGKIRSWKMDQNLSDDTTPFREGLSWQAHKGPVICMVMSCYGN